MIVVGFILVYLCFFHFYAFSWALLFTNIFVQMMISGVAFKQLAKRFQKKMSEVNFRAAKVKSSMRKGDMSVPPPPQVCILL